MKVLPTSLFALLLVAVLLLSSCGMDLSHKHYTDDYGYCRSCETDTAHLLQKNADGIYVTEELPFPAYTDVFLTFRGEGEGGLTVTVTPLSTAEVAAIILYSESDDYIASRYDRQDPVLKYSEPLEDGVLYYVRIKPSVAGAIKVIIEPNS